MEIATLAGGCFWCTEAIFERLKGVTSVTSGYAGGQGENPSYESVSTGLTGHAEAIQIGFNPAVISYGKLLQIFFATHDPTTTDRQGNDIGSQYRSIIFYHSEAQRQTAIKVKSALASGGQYRGKIITEIVPFQSFNPAEDHHQDFYRNNPDHAYCRVVIDPKVKKLLHHFSNDVKPEYLQD